MRVIGLLSNKQEAKQIKNIAKICAIEDRIRLIVRMDKIKYLLKKEHKDLKED